MNLEAGKRNFWVDDIIRRLLEMVKGNTSNFVLSKSEVDGLRFAAQQMFVQEPSLLQLNSPIKIAGDIHGEYDDLIRIFQCGGFPPKSNYVFLGNYVDFGSRSLETICLLFAIKIKYPKNIFLLRGNHECVSMNTIYGFDRDCMSTSFNVFEFADCFNCLPIAALIDAKILCIHGGLSPNLQDLDQIRHIERPTFVRKSGLLCDLLWSDPSMAIQGWAANANGRGYTFGADKLKEFLERNGLDLICRGHQIVEDGYEILAQGRLVTIFSAPDFNRELGIVGAVMSVDANLTYSFEILKPDTSGHRRNKATTTQPDQSPYNVAPIRRTSINKYGEEPLWTKQAPRVSTNNIGNSNTLATKSSSMVRPTERRLSRQQVNIINKLMNERSIGASAASGSGSSSKANPLESNKVEECDRSNPHEVKPKSTSSTVTTKSGISSKGDQSEGKFRTISSQVKPKSTSSTVASNSTSSSKADSLKENKTEGGLTTISSQAKPESTGGTVPSNSGSSSKADPSENESKGWFTAISSRVKPKSKSDAVAGSPRRSPKTYFSDSESEGRFSFTSLHRRNRQSSSPSTKPVEKTRKDNARVSPSECTSASKFRSNSADAKHDERANRLNYGVTATSESSAGASSLRFAPKARYRSTSPRIERFFGTRV